MTLRHLPELFFTMKLIIEDLSEKHQTPQTLKSDVGSVFKLEYYQKAVKRVGLVQTKSNAGLSFANQAIESFSPKDQDRNISHSVTEIL